MTVLIILKIIIFSKSKIIKAILNNQTQKCDYKAILENVYKIINDGTINIKTIKKDNWFSYYKNLSISVRSVTQIDVFMKLLNNVIKIILNVIF